MIILFQSQKGHQFVLQHIYKQEFCMHCNKALWGVGFQGYQCQSKSTQYTSLTACDYGKYYKISNTFHFLLSNENVCYQGWNYKMQTGKTLIRLLHLKPCCQVFVAAKPTHLGTFEEH